MISSLLRPTIQSAPSSHAREVAGVEPAFGVDDRGGEVRGAVVALHQPGAADMDLADLARGDGLAVGAEQAELDARDGLAHGIVAARPGHPGHGDGRRAFGDAVAVVQRQAEEPLDPFLEVEVERGAGGREQPELRQVQPGDALQRAMLADALEHRGHAEEPGDALPLQRRQRGLGLEARREVDRAAREQGGHQHRGEADDVRDRQHAVEPILRAHPAHDPRGGGDEQDVAVGQHDALGRAGRAGGVEQHGDALGRVGGRGFGHDIRGERAEPQRTDIRQIEEIGSVPLGMGAGIGRGGDAVEHAPRAGVVADQIDLARAEPGIDHHRPGLGRRDGQDQGGLGDAVLRHHHDPVAGPDALLPQPAAQEGDVPG